MRFIKSAVVAILILCAGLIGGCGLLFGEFVPAPDSLTGDACFSTPADMEGPYYVAGAPFKDVIYPEGMQGQRLIVSGTVYSAGCAGVLSGAVIDVWQADANGEYDFSDQFILRGKVTADENGAYQFETILPARYEPRPPHIHLKISHPDVGTLTTQLYFEGQGNGGAPELVIPLTSSNNVLYATFDFVLVP